MSLHDPAPWQDDDHNPSDEDFATPSNAPTMWARRSTLRDRVALQDEFTHGDREQRRRIGELVLRGESEPIEETAQRLVEELEDETLRAIVCDWLDAEVAI